LCREYEIDFAVRHFPLHPDTPAEGMTLEQLFAGRNFDIAASQQRMIGLMQAEGLPYSDRSMTFNSTLAQEFAAWAFTKLGPNSQRDAITQHQICDAIYRAYFVDNKNIASHEPLLQIAADLGLPADEARQVIESRSFRNAVQDDWTRCRELGISGVPMFVIGNQGVSGAQPYDVLEEFVTQCGAAKR
jgi:predicted DsbA family dithiol-disulfide isomerase